MQGKQLCNKEEYRWRGTNAITIFPLYAQHAFAEMSLSAGIPIENIAKMRFHIKHADLCADDGLQDFGISGCYCCGANDW